MHISMIIMYGGTNNMKKRISITHDLHQHSFLSSCSYDPEMTPKNLFSNAIDNGYNTICITDHVWDSNVTGASDWYSKQDINHISKSVEKIQSVVMHSNQNIRFYFGCETEYCGGKKLGLSKQSFDLFDFVVIPVNHFHMMDFVRPSNINTASLVAELFLTRLEELQQLDLPWEKIGIAHFTTSLLFREGKVEDVLKCMSEQRLKQIFEFIACHGTGIELNACCFRKGWENNSEILLRPYTLAKQAGCKFYFCTDAHAVKDLSSIYNLESVISLLSLSEDDIYKIP